MLKLLGAVLIALASTSIGYGYAKKLVRRAQEIRQLRACLSLLETEIHYGTRPLAEACEYIASREKGAISRLFALSSQELRRIDGGSTYQCFQKAVERAWQETALKEDEKNIFLRLAQVLGRSDRVDQLHHLKQACVQLGIEEEKAREEQRRYEKMYKTLGILSGILIIILMI